jgi:hypothetical protein
MNILNDGPPGEKLSYQHANSRSPMMQRQVGLISDVF